MWDRAGHKSIQWGPVDYSNKNRERTIKARYLFSFSSGDYTNPRYQYTTVTSHNSDRMCRETVIVQQKKKGCTAYPAAVLVIRFHSHEPVD